MNFGTILKKNFKVLHFMPTSSVKKLVNGVAGFVGSHLVDRLIKSGGKVICLDNFFYWE